MKRKCILVLVLALMLSLFAGIMVACTEKKGPSGGGESETFNKVVFYDNFPGGEIETVEVKEGEKVAKPEDPQRPGYDFEGWFTQYDGGEQFDFEQTITSDAKAFASWERNSYEVVYKLNNGQGDKFDYISVGGKLERPENPVRDQYNFSGWFSDPECTKAYQFGGTLSSDIIIYAGWAQTSATLTFDYNYTGSPAAFTQIVEIGQKATLPEEPEREMYRFDGWYTGRDNDSEKFDFNGAVSSDTTLYAHWVRTHYKVTFNLNYTDAQNIEVLAEVGGAATAPEVTRTGYTFEGWYLDSECKTKADLTEIDSDMVVYANWTLMEYTVTFDLNYENAPAGPAAQKVKFNQTAEEPEAPERENYKFIAWYTDSEGGDQFTFDTPITEDITLYARWMDESGETPDTVTMTFRYNLPGMDVYKTVDMPYASIALLYKPADPALEGYYFDTWYTDAECTKEFSFYSVVMEDTVLYARLLKQHTFEAELVDLGGKEGKGSSVNYFEDAMIINQKLIGTNDKNPGSSFVSNGYYLTGLYYAGAYIDFEITAAEEVDNAVLEMRVSSECYQQPAVLDYTMFQIIVNGTYNDLGEPVSGIIQHSGVTLPPATEGADEDPNKTPFTNCIVYTKLHLEKGENVIRMRVNNQHEYGGTFNASAPMIDCIYIYTSVDITMKEYTEFIERVYDREGVTKTMDAMAKAAYAVGKSRMIAEG